ncbi:1-acyl-sn-glycerol-3-phosphate acyltransferase [Zobellia galactanivorans]|uniref:Acyltransferase family protein n=1 Tax=Zobellia galactanivorans (strain DSM 12802 / CCUG 47099 / CIP 106680 / NCIMB 13871 / Dsij) TaxID=63186 RepID=G0L0Z0_ZOBGA|nr:MULTISPECIES: 1-acyl-sn-glycerol-3-phosphate acyltransferase [Zobellia]MBU3027009.1 1-acyl-sn-glycerol-3-phosphate acyltransferase [Zobellia galactanivorans]MDO6810271.1 1-acyl-sn-glycerol-3-phosphate acyltransferase [Zobellia galactanivorans]OWW23858.1 acyltransferase [Zobellia sp. OII3]CAZ94551.1 Acyltransferase family protein [Zobellia galactanivorans]
MQRLARFIYFKLMGWKMVGTFPGHLDKFVIAVVPHTSYVDFFLGLLIRKIWNEPINFVGKKSLFAFPFGFIFRKLGGEPIDRSKNNDMVSATVKVFQERKKFRLTIAPEGTRKKVDKWKTGFYYIAKGAQVPVVLVAFDFGKKQVKISEPLYTTDDKDADFKVYEDFFKGVVGKIPRQP